MASILISYRRSDSDVTGRISDRLLRKYTVFRDIDNIPIGKDFRKAIENALRTADVLIAVVGSNWQGARKGSPSKIFDPNDNVRIEIETALLRDIHIIPVLVGGATMPKPDDLPDTLRGFSFRNATSVDSGRNFETDVQRLISAVDSLFGWGKPPNARRAFIEAVNRADLRDHQLPSFELPSKLRHEVAEKILPYVPGLRHYARALTGSQVLGDKLVSTTLYALDEEPVILRSEIRDRVALYRLFTQVRTRTSLPAPSPPLDEYYNRLCHVPTTAAEAFLLYNFEQFGQDEASEILGVDVPGLHTLIYQASNELRRQLVTDALIIEDETFIGMELEMLVKDYLGHNVIGIARTHAEAVSMAKKKQPGLILADIQLADGSSGIDAVMEMLASFSAVVVFITAYPERLLSGPRCEPAFLIAKPFQPTVVVSVITGALFFKHTASLGQARGLRSPSARPTKARMRSTSQSSP
jgi:DNA-directed RNA polymerase specialized sigma24 family protein/DNA-binding NarL/FixJ family response regulator